MLALFPFLPVPFYLQCAQVIGIRCGILATGGPFCPEATNMVSEKISAFTSASLKLATGTFPDVVAGELRAVVSGNLDRLHNQ